MFRKMTIMTSMIVALTMAGTAAVGSTHVDFGISELDLEYTTGTRHMMITATEASTLEAWLADDITVFDALTLDGATMPPGDLYSLEMDFIQNGVNDWSGTGTVILEDRNSQVLAAEFETTSVVIDDRTFELKLKGHLRPTTGNDSVLAYSGSTWDITNGTDTLSVSNPSSFDVGTMINTQFTVWGGMTEDEFFDGSNESIALPNGDSRITVTPVPAGVVLGFIGLSMIGIRMRKHA